jgi:pimeloyl-ACP methyl ester carboxylesterase
VKTSAGPNRTIGARARSATARATRAARVYDLFTVAVVKLLSYAVLLLAVFLAASLGAFWLAVRPPRFAVPGRPRDYALPAEEVTITSEDGLRLSAWLIPRPGASAIVLLHGYPAEKADMLPLAATLHPDFALLLLDLRYFGGSEGRATTLGLRERRDLSRAIDLLEARGYSRVGVFGFSLGGAVAILAAAEDPRIRAVAAYAPFADVRALARDLYSSLWLLKYPLVEAMTLWAWLFFGGDLAHPTPETAARTLTVPVLLIASRADDQIPFSHAERLRRALAGNPAAEFAFTERGRHGEIGRDLEGRIVDFFRRRLGPRGQPTSRPRSRGRGR